MDTGQTSRFIVEYFAATEYNAFWSAREFPVTSGVSEAGPSSSSYSSSSISRTKTVSLKVIQDASSSSSSSRPSTPLRSASPASSSASSPDSTFATTTTKTTKTTSTTTMKPDVPQRIAFYPNTSIDAEDIDWNAILEATSCVAVVETAFDHVERSIDSALVKGMILEARIRDLDHFATDQVDHAVGEVYWVAEILMSCGPLLELQFLGLEHRKIFSEYSHLSDRFLLVCTIFCFTSFCFCGHD